MYPSEGEDVAEEELYARLTNLLSRIEVSEIEISNCPLVPSETPNQYHPFVICDRTQLAIPQKPLLIVYGHACRKFGTIYENLADLLKLATSFDTDWSDSELFQVTQVLLIQNSDHLTALSCRRKLIESLISDPRADSVKKRLISRELNLTKLILSIASHAKSAALWFHRRWCFQKLLPASKFDQNPPTLSLQISQTYYPFADLPPDALKDELEFNLKCCHLYPHNYFGWFHRRWLVHQLLDSCQRDPKLELLAEQIRILKFLSLHPRDHSCSTYINYLIQLSSTHLARALTDAEAGRFLREYFSVLREHAESDTLWSFIKLTLLSKKQDNGAIQYLEFINQMASQVKKWLDSIEKPDGRLAISLVTSPASHDVPLIRTLADQEKEALRRSLFLGLRTFYLLGCHENWIHWSSETTKDMLEMTKNQCHPLCSDNYSGLLIILKSAVDKFISLRSLMTISNRLKS